MRVAALCALAGLGLVLSRTALVEAQGRGGLAQGRGSADASTPRASAPIDLTGYWVSIVTQDWRWRMVTPPKGDYESIPITLEAKKVGDMWDPAKDEAAGEACKGYGAAAIMALPTRLHIAWQDDSTLKVETDTGTQTRLFHFGDWKPEGRIATWQGDSIAVWERARAARGAAARGGALRIVTTNLRPGYVRKNGVPYSSAANLTEYWDLGEERNGDRWITITSVLEDSQYLRVPYTLALQFKKEADASRWDPTPCSAR
jgi:hypothetical protein